LPGVVHLIYGFAIALLLMYFTNYRFSSRFAIVYAINCWLGPDFGAIIWASTYKIGDPWASIILFIFHNPYTFPIVWAFLLARLWKYLTQLDIHKVNEKNKIYQDPVKGLSFRQCYLLIVAGGFTHFNFDYIFDSAGKSPTFLWVIHTGCWDDSYYDYSVIFVGILVIFLILGYLRINNNTNSNPERIKLRNTAFFLISITIVYEIFLGIRLSMGLPALGEEADFGLVIFSAVFYILPLVLCAWALDLEKDRKITNHQSKNN
jgi:hypothetical protein